MKSNIINQINSIVSEKPTICITLGSGLNSFIKKIKKSNYLLYSKISGFLQTSVSGHEGKFVFGYLNGHPILCACGRFHYYEGYSLDQVGIIQKIFNNYKPKINIITNSSGNLRLDWEIGDFMIIKKFIDYSFIESNVPKVYNLNKTNIPDINLHQGTYAFTIGPTYETKSEILDIIKFGGDAVGMSTFPEYIMCKKLKMNCIIISCLTNYGAGLKNKEIKHLDVLKNADLFKDNFYKIICKIIENM